MAEMTGSFSTGHLAYEHDVRLTYTKNVSEELIQDDDILEDNLSSYYWYEENGEVKHRTQEEAIEMYVNEMMKPTIQEYNKGKKKSRQIDENNYVEYWKSNANLSKGKTRLVYEAVMQVGEHETNGGLYYKAKGKERVDLKKQYKKMYSEALQEFKKKYPHLKIVWAVLHLDEENGTPHVHIAYCPVGENYKKGLPKQVSIGNALACDGIERSEVRQNEEGFQLTRMYAKARKEIVQAKIAEYFPEYTIKEEVHGRKHQPPRTWYQGKETTFIDEYFRLKLKQYNLERTTPEIKKGKTFGHSIKVQNEVHQMIERRDPEDDIRTKMDEWDKELTRIENAQNEPIDDPMELVPDDEFEY